MTFYIFTQRNQIAEICVCTILKRVLIYSFYCAKFVPQESGRIKCLTNFTSLPWPLAYNAVRCNSNRVDNANRMLCSPILLNGTQLTNPNNKS